MHKQEQSTGDDGSILALKPMVRVNWSPKQRVPVAPQNGVLVTAIFLKSRHGILVSEITEVPNPVGTYLTECSATPLLDSVLTLTAGVEGNEERSVNWNMGDKSIFIIFNNLCVQTPVTVLNLYTIQSLCTDPRHTGSQCWICTPQKFITNIWWRVHVHWLISVSLWWFICAGLSTRFRQESDSINTLLNVSTNRFKSI